MHLKDVKNTEQTPKLALWGLLLIFRKIHGERAALIDSAFHVDFSMTQIDHSLDHRESNAIACLGVRFISLVELFKNMLLYLIAHSDARIRNRDDYTIFLLAQANGDAASHGGELDGV